MRTIVAIACVFMWTAVACHPVNIYTHISSNDSKITQTSDEFTYNGLTINLNATYRIRKKHLYADIWVIITNGSSESVSISSNCISLIDSFYDLKLFRTNIGINSGQHAVLENDTLIRLPKSDTLVIASFFTAKTDFRVGYSSLEKNPVSFYLKNIHVGPDSIELGQFTAIPFSLGRE